MLPCPPTVTKPRQPALVALGAALVASCMASPAWAAVPPVVQRVSAEPTTVLPGATLLLTVEASDADCVAGVCTTGCGAYVRDDLIQWTTVGGTFGSFAKVAPGSPGSPATGSRSPYVGQAKWTAPAAEGDYTVSVSVSDSGTSMCGGRKSASASIAVRVSTSTNGAPAVSAVTASPGQAFPGDDVALTCAATDPDGDALTISWSTDNGTAGGAASGRLVPERPGLATVICTATDPAGAKGSGETRVAVTGAMAAESLAPQLHAPHRVAADSMGDLYIVDGGGGIAVVNYFSKALVYYLPARDVKGIAVDWADRLLVGGRSGARLLSRDGTPLGVLVSAEALGAVADVAVDLSRQRYALLHRDSRRVVVFDSGGRQVAAFGTPAALGADGQPVDSGDSLVQPVAIAFTPAGAVAVADGATGRIKIFETTGALVLSVGGMGGGAGHFVQLSGVAVDADGMIYASDAYQSWVQVFAPDGTLREVLGTHGDGLGQLKTPVGLGAFPALRRLVVTSANSSRLQAFRFAGAGPAPRMPHATVSTTALAFAGQAVGTRSAPLQLTLVNDGQAPLGIGSVTLAGDFDASHDCGRFLDPGHACRLSVTFAPLVPGASRGELTIDTVATDGRRVIALSGEGQLAPSLALSVAKLSFGSQVVGASSAPQVLGVANSGGAPLALSGIRVSGPFGFSSACGPVLAPGAHCTLDVAFAPTVAGLASGEVVVESSAAPFAAVVALEGTGVARRAQVDPALLQFGHRRPGARPAVRSIVVANVGAPSFRVIGLEILGPQAFAYTVVRDFCSGRDVEPGAGCQIEVAFAPDAEASFTAQVRFDVDAAEGAVFTELRGRGDPLGPEPIFEDDFESGELSRWTFEVTSEVSIVRVHPRDMDGPATLIVSLGSAQVGGQTASRTLTVENLTGDVVSVDAVSLKGKQAGEFVILEDRCRDTALAPGAGCSLVVAFRPSQTRPAQARLRVRLLGQAVAGEAVFVLNGGLPGSLPQ